ncbi:hypothetical protein T11_11633 [Trichinella zimbabwensis]|uniref:Uncharacterized protein n=1 Tax=Trichinella zimbabwensis TaxID=268475 RepID=A0A0V1H834_9BILA|nr:hypothetical protein T11_11633 [Trichinella zimbabwensis]
MTTVGEFFNECTSSSRALDAVALAILFRLSKFACLTVVTVCRVSCVLKYVALCLCLNRLLWICKAYQKRFMHEKPD